MPDEKSAVTEIIRCLGGAENIADVTNCMTRLRVVVKDEAAVQEDALKNLDAVLGLVHDRPCAYEVVVGPGKCRKYADLCYAMGLGKSAAQAEEGVDKPISKTLPAKQGKDNKVRDALKLIGDIFVPLIPGIITAGLCAGFASLIAQAVPDYADSKFWNLLFHLLSLVNVSFMTYISAWVGYRAAERFGATPILGGMLGMITSLDGINDIAKLIGLYNEASPLSSVLHAGKGGVLAVIFGVLLLAAIEKRIRARMPDSLDVVFTPLLSLLICAVPYIAVLMPLLGYVASGIAWVFSHLCLSGHVLVRALTGFVSAALFLPLVATGMHHGLVALYTVQLQELGYITLYPALAMAGAGQVGAALAIWRKAKRAGNSRLCRVTAGALPAGLLGVGEPLIYGVTLPLGRPFITAGIGAGFGGALVMAAEVASTTWGPSGLLGLFVMTAGPNGAVKSVLFYLAGLLVAYVCSYIITDLTLDEKTLGSGAETAGKEPARKAPEKAPTAEKVPTTEKTPEPAPGEPASGRRVQHGEPVSLAAPGEPFAYTLTDPHGIHARPAGELVKLVSGYDCEVSVAANGKTASAGSLVELMELGAVQGTTLTVSARGRDAAPALEAVRQFLAANL